MSALPVMLTERMVSIMGLIAQNFFKLKSYFGILLGFVVLLLPVRAIGTDPPKEMLAAKINLQVKWDKRDDAGNRRHGRLGLNIQGLLKLNRQFSSLEQGLPAVMVPYTVSIMSGHYSYEDKEETAKRNHCANPAVRYSGSGGFTIEPYPGPGNLMLHYMGKMSEQMAQVRHMAPAGAFDALIDRYLFGVTVPKQEVKGTRQPDHEPCEPRQVTRQILGDKIQIHFKFDDDGTMSGHRHWSSDADPSAHVSVSNLPDVFKAKPFVPAEASPADVSYNLRWEIKEARLARIWLEVELPNNKKGWKDITDDQADITVGKQLRFKGVVLPKGKTDEPVGDWTLEGDGKGEHEPFFKKFDADIHHGRVIALDPQKDLKSKHMITLFWSGGKQGTIRFATSAGGESLTAQAKLNVVRPNYRVDISARPGSTIGPAFTGGALNEDCMGTGAHGAVKDFKWWLQYDGIEFNATNEDKGKIDGQEQWVQILRRHDLWVKFDDNYDNHQYVTDALDRCYPYQRGPKAMDKPGVPLGEKENESITEEHNWVDDQDNIVKTTSGTMMHTKAIQECRMVLMFKPDDKKGQTEWVPLKEILWTWNASAEYSRAYHWQVSESKVTPPTPKAEDSDIFPEWEKNSADMKNYVVE